MSSNKCLFLSSDSQNRDSFSERICDDLSEEILQYLPLKDKLILESVSKQFQWTALKKHNKLVIGTYNEKSIENNLFGNNSFDLKKLESLLKKCPNITSIDLTFTGYDAPEFKCFNYNEFILLITKYCNNLIEFKAPLSEISVSAFTQFHKKFGSKIKFFKLIERKEDLVRLSSFANLEVLEVRERQTDKLVKSLSEMDFKKLKAFKTHYIIEKMFLKDVIDKFKTIRHLDLPLHYSHNWDNRVLKSVLNLNDLVHLRIDLKIVSNREIISDLFKQIPISCPKLKSIDCRLDDCYKNNSELSQLLSPLKALKDFKRLKLEYNYENYCNLEVNRKFQFSLFQGFPNITHFSLEYYSVSIVDQTFFEYIETYLPNLQYLCVSSKFETTAEETTQIVNILSRLSRLESIKLQVNCKFIGQQLIKEIKEKCKNIRTIDVLVFKYYGKASFGFRLHC